MKKSAKNLVDNVLNRIRKTTKRNRRGAKRVTSSSSKLAIEPLEDRHLLAASYFSPSEPAGSVNVQLVPLANVAVGTQEIVTFGVPFTRGSLSQSQLSQVRVLKNGQEIPAFVEQLTPWRSIDNVSVDGQSVRVARIQIPYTFASLSPESVTVQWGGSSRTLNRSTMQDPRIEWHQVTSGSFVAADNVEEPDVLPVLPKEYLSKGMFDARTQSTSNNVAETRDDPAIMDSMAFTGYSEYDYAEKNFFYTIINQNPGITINYKTDYEPWLYDRSSAMYELYLRSGFATSLREAVRSADFYADHLSTSGYFTLRSSDPKYSYNESLAYTYWLLGDNRMLAPISTVVSAHSGTASRWSPNLSFWTERNVGYKLLANEIAYEVTGNASFKTGVQTIVNDLIWHQNGAGGQLPGNRIDGALYHTGGQHDASEVGDPNVIIASSWMSALVVDAMVRSYGVWENTQIADFMVRMGNFEKAASKFDANGQFGGFFRYPDYLMRADGTTENRSDTDVQHAVDVGSVAAWATYFAELRGAPDASLRQLANDLYATYDEGVNYWTRPGGTNFNVSPPRRYNWEYKNSSSFSWALNGTDGQPSPGVLQLDAAAYTADEQQGSIVITVARTGGSLGAVSVNYATSNGTATAGSDYTNTNGTITFAAGQTSATFTVPILNDTTVEGNETVNISLSGPTGGATLGSRSTATLTIVSDDVPQPGVLQFSAASYTVNENAGTATITVARSGGSDGSVAVNYATSNGTATAGSDYTTSSGTLTFANGETSKTFSIPILNDTTVENAETVTLTLSNPAGGATLGNQSTATLTINSDDTSGQPVTVTLQQGVSGYTGTSDVNISTQYAQYTEGNGTTTFNDTQLGVYQTSGSGSYTVESLIRFSDLGIPTNANVNSATMTLYVDTWTSKPTVRGYYLLAPWSSTPGSNANQVGWLHRGTGQNWTTPGARGVGTDIIANSNFVLSGMKGNGGQSITVNLDPAIVQSWINNPNANQGVLLVNETTGGIVRINASEHATTATRPKLSVTYSVGTPQPQPGVLQFNAASYSVNENAGSATITVSRGGGSDGSVSVNYATTNGTATAGSDYTSSSGTLTLATGQTSATFTVPILNDTAVEGNETVNVTLSNPAGGATLGNQSTATLTIISDDVLQPGVLQFNAASYSVNENAGSATITVTRTGGSDGSVSVSYATSNGTATAGSDYTASSGILTFANGVTSKTFSVPILDDTTVENAETVSLTLSNPAGGATLGSPSTSTLTINSDDTSGQPVTVTLQQGVNAYTGTSDVSISTQYVEYTGGNGSTTFTDAQLNVFQTVGTGSYTIESLIRFSNLGIPAGATVNGATLTLYVDSWDPNPTLRGYYLLAPWSAIPSSNSTQVGWLHRGTGQDWASLGALGLGSDIVANPTFVLSGITGNGGQSITVNLDPAVVQSWVNNPNANQGVLLVNESTGAIVRINASEHATVATHPKLSVTYVVGTPQPQPGVLQFNAASYNVNENAGTAAITVTRTAGSDGSVSVNYATTNGTATAGSDYTSSSGTLTLAAGQTTATFTVPILNDTAVEGDETVNISLSNPTGGATLGNQTTATLTIISDDVLNPPVVHTPFIPLHPVDLSSADYVRFKAWVDQAVAGNPGYEFSATDAAIMYRLTGQIIYANLAISMVEADVTAAEIAIAAGNRPIIAGDSYLYVGGMIRNLALTYDWAYDLLTQSQRNRWAAYAEQAVWNVWNPNQARWGAVSYPWSGWSINNPGNNYFYSFVNATMHWGLASQSTQWLNLLRNDKFPLTVAYFQNLPGGGSREGTGYGSSHRELFAIYRIWEEATGEDLASQSSHARESIDYWIHATLPTLDRFAPIGDQARDSSASLYDYQETLMLEAVALNPNTPEAARGTWWLNHNSVVQMQHGFNYRHALLREQQPESTPVDLVYRAQGTGHLFARTSWDTDATWMSFVAGTYNESHAHQDQGSFSLFQDQWLAVTENIYSHSGIQQGTDVHNVVRFVKNGTTIRQTFNSQSSMSFTDVNGLLSIQANLNNAYSGSSADVQGWQRDLTFNRATNLIRVHDQFQVANGVSAIWQINVPVQPIIQSDGTIKAGDLLITPLTPGVQVSILDWRTVNASEFTSGWKVELRGASEYTVDLAVNHLVQAASGNDPLVFGSPGNLSVADSNGNAGTATITVSRTGGSDGSVSVNDATSSGTAKPSSDPLKKSADPRHRHSQTNSSRRFDRRAVDELFSKEIEPLLRRPIF